MGRIVGLILKDQEPAKEPVKEPSKFDGMDIEQLKVYAGENGINIGNATSVNGII